jgi:crossover junction endodeoxyribonuclease RuvC
VKVFGIDPGSFRTGYGCIDTDGSRHRLVTCGTIVTSRASCFPERLQIIHDGLAAAIQDAAPDCVAIESVFHSANARSAILLGHVRGVALLAARQAGRPIVEYTPAAVKRALVGTGRAEKGQVQLMVVRLLALGRAPRSLDTTDALAVAICHAHTEPPNRVPRPAATGKRSWRQVRPDELPLAGGHGR